MIIPLNRERKPIGERNGLKIFSTLKSRKGLNKVSQKQKVKNKKWKEITDEKFEQVGRICLWCGKSGQRFDPINPINGHHIERRNGHNNTLDNCYPVHNFCHNEITDKNIDVTTFKNRTEWEKRNEKNIKLD